MTERTNGTPLTDATTDTTTHASTDAVTQPRTGAEPAATTPRGSEPSAEPGAREPELEHGRHRSAEELVQCPECGSAAMVTLNQRAAADFCAQCDFPLFWTPSRVVRETDAHASSESLQRLPGTVGRTTVASLACPRCAEQNPVTGVTCVRCGAPLHPEPAPPPAPAPEPQPVPVAEPEPSRAWIWVLAFVLSCLILIAVAWYTSG